MTRDACDLGIATVPDALVSLNVGGLKKLAALLPTRGPTRKADLVRFIAGHLRGERLREIFESLDELQRAAVAEVVHAPDARFEHDRFRAKYGRDPEWGSLDEWSRDAMASPLRFFFYGDLMPDDLKAELAAFVPKPSDVPLVTFEELPAGVDRPLDRHGSRTEWIALVVRETERTAQHELHAVLRLVDAGRVAVSDATRRPTASAVKAVAAVLEGGDFYEDEPGPDGDPDAPGPIRAFAWPLLLQAAGLAERAGSRLRLTKLGRKALVEPPARTLRLTWARWLEASILDELCRIECIRGRTGRESAGSRRSPGGARRSRRRSRSARSVAGSRSTSSSATCGPRAMTSRCRGEPGTSTSPTPTTGASATTGPAAGASSRRVTRSASSSSTRLRWG